MATNRTAHSDLPLEEVVVLNLVWRYIVNILGKFCVKCFCKVIVKTRQWCRSNSVCEMDLKCVLNCPYEVSCIECIEECV